MCGRFAQFSSVKTVAKQFGVPEDHVLAVEEPPRYNIAPSANILAVRNAQGGERELVSLKWGLVPHWSPEPRTSYSTANAKAETVDTKPAFRAAFKSRRCLIPVDGWYEWQLLPDQKFKQPWFYHDPHDQPLGIAGLWESWVQGSHVLESCTIIVCDANDVARPVHDRMPVVLAEADWEAWLDPRLPAEAAKSMLRQCPNDWISAYPVSRAVSLARNEGPELIKPINVT